MVDCAAIERNLRILAEVQRESGAVILAALKAFAMWRLGDLIGKYLGGTCASGPYEARLGREKFGGAVHTFSAAYSARDLTEVLALSDHVVFNSISQWTRFRGQCLAAQRLRPELRFGLRINPQHSEGQVPLYNPCAPGSRLGIPRARFEERELSGISGLHFHTLCEHDFPPLDRTLSAVERHFGAVLQRMQWVNFGGGHHITRDDYQRDALISRVRAFHDKYRVKVYLEPGEAIALNAGVLVAEVIDLIWNEIDQAILDTSATCHMPDVLEMPYRPNLLHAGEPNDYPYTYRLGGQTCLAGDRIGDYSFRQPLKIGQRLLFDDMAIYTMVKTSTFNGVPLPSIALWNSDSDELEIVRRPHYADFFDRLS